MSKQRAGHTLISKRMALLSALSLALNAFVGWACWVWAVLPFGSTFFLGLSLAWPMLVLGALAVGVLSATSLRDRQARPGSVGTLLLCAATVLGACLGYAVGSRQRMDRIRDVVLAAKPLTQALHSYERDNGHPPRALDELVPRYLPAVPATGMGGYPAWECVTRPDAYAGNSWILRVRTVGPAISFDELLYFPNQRYPSVGEGGTFERVADWAYVHD